MTAEEIVAALREPDDDAVLGIAAAHWRIPHDHKKKWPGARALMIAIADAIEAGELRRRGA